MMEREIDFDISEIDRIYISSDFFYGWYDGRRIFAGYSGENNATLLSFTFRANFDGYTITLLLEIGGEQYEVVSDTDDFDYYIPSTYMVPEMVVMQIKATLGTQVLYSEEVYLEVRR